MTFNFKIPFCVGVVMLSSVVFPFVMYTINKKDYSTKNIQTEYEEEECVDEITLLENIKNELINIKLLLEE